MSDRRLPVEGWGSGFRPFGLVQQYSQGDFLLVGIEEDVRSGVVSLGGKAEPFDQFLAALRKQRLCFLLRVFGLPAVRVFSVRGHDLAKHVVGEKPAVLKSGSF